MELIAYQLSDTAPRIVSGQIRRSWMDESNDKYAYRCLPLTIANQSGWDILCPCDMIATWNGRNNINDVLILAHTPLFAVTHFGEGVITFHTNYLFRTTSSYHLKVEGSPNHPKDGIYPLTGIVETDWLNATFTVNWKFTRPGTISFEKDEPFCRISLIPKNLQEQVNPKIKNINDVPETKVEYEKWKVSRSSFLKELPVYGTPANQLKWQKDYMLGKGSQPGQHQMKLNVKEFNP